MGYTTEFNGFFNLTFNDKTKQDKVINLVNGLASTRRMKRDLSKIEDTLKEPISYYGIDGEFYYEDSLNYGQNDNISIVDRNTPPSTQPGLWLQWIIEYQDKDTYILEWDQGEKFYNYIEWLEYLIEKIFKPNNVSISGSVEYRGEDWEDIGTITIKDNKIINTYTN